MGRKSRRDIVRENLDICVGRLLNVNGAHSESFYIKHDDLWVEMCVLHRDKLTHQPIRINLKVDQDPMHDITMDFLQGITVGCCVGRKTLVDIYTEYVLKRIQVINAEKKKKIKEEMKDAG